MRNLLKWGWRACFMMMVAGAVNAQERAVLVQPVGTHLLLTKLATEESSAEFSGKMWVTGTLIGQWPGGAQNTDTKNPEFVLIPDRPSRAALPYFKLQLPNQLIRYRVTVVDVENGEEALTMAGQRSTVELLRDRKIDEAKVVGSFLIGEYGVSVECDSPYAHAKVEEVRIPSAKLAMASVRERC